MPKIRAFIAVDLPQDIKMELDKLIASFRPASGGGIRWVRAENLHITLRFLGDIDREEVPGLAENIKKNVDGFGRFDLAISGLGGFPNLQRPRVIWVGAGSGEDRLGELATRVEKACMESRFGKADKPFSSHLTIGRVKFSQGLGSILEKVENTSFETAPFEISAVIVFKSDLFPAGPKYTVLETIRL
jgi:2'-5' RNA ligase